MKIALLSDSHDSVTLLPKAISAANQANCQHLIHAGDLISPFMIEFLAEFKGEIHMVWGNNDGDRPQITENASHHSHVHLHGREAELEIDDLKIHVNHYPNPGELAAKSGDYDLVVHGHTHQHRVETIGDTILINPGEICGYLTGKSTFVIFDSQSKEFETITLAPA